MGRFVDGIVRRAACVALAASSALACSLTFDADELTSGGGAGASSGGNAGSAGRAGNPGSAGASGSARGGSSGSSAGGSSGKAGAAGKGGAAEGGAGAGGVGAGAAGREASGGTNQAGRAGAGGAGGGAGTPPLGARQIYWLDQGDDTVNRAESDGSNPDMLVDIGLTSYLRSIAIDPVAGKLYYTDDQRNRVQSANLDGSDAGDLILDLDNPVGIDLDVPAGKLYFVDQGNAPTVYRADLDGSNLEPLITDGIEHPYGIALDLAARHMYLVDNGVNAVFRADLDGANLTNLNVPGVDLPIQISLDLDAGKLYWSEIGDVPRIRRANLDGSAPEDIVSAASFDDFTQPLGLKVDVAAHVLYFVDGDSIRRSALDGSGVVSVLTDLDAPVGLALFY